MVTIRRAAVGDAMSIADVYLASFSATYDFPLAHTEAEVRAWFASHVLVRLETWLAVHDERVVGFVVLSDKVLEQLCVHPDRTGEGVGGDLVGVAKLRRPNGLELWTFQVNEGARRFYARHGFEEVEWTDGGGNEEGQPDVRCVWRPES